MASLPFVDEFTGTDGDPLGTGWVDVIGSWEISDNEAEATAWDVDGNAQACIDVGAVTTQVATVSSKGDFTHPSRPVWGMGYRASVTDPSGVWVSFLVGEEVAFPALTSASVLLSEVDAVGAYTQSVMATLQIDRHGWVVMTEIDSTRVEVASYSSARVVIDRVVMTFPAPVTAAGTAVGIYGARMTDATPGGYVDVFAAPFGLVLDASWTVATSLRIIPTPPVVLTASWDVDCTMIVATVGEQRRTRIVRIDGTLVAELASAQHGPIDIALNDINTGSFTVPANSPDAALIQAQELQEVQLWRGNRCLLWGPITRYQVSGGTLTASVSGAEWYLTRTYVGPHRRHNYLDDAPQFGPAGGVIYLHETGNAPEIGDSKDAPTYGDGPTIEVVSAAEFDQPQTWVSTELTSAVTPNITEGIRWFATVWAYIRSSQIHGMPSGHAFLTLVRGSTTVPNESELVRRLQPDAMAIVEISTAVLQPDDVPLNRWFRLECDLTQPQLASGEHETIRMQLAAIPGTIFYARPGLWADDGLRYREVAQGQILKELVAHAQDMTPGADKSQLNLRLHPSGSQVNRARNRTYIFAEHPGVWDALVDFSRLDNGVDLRTTYSASSRDIMAESPRVTRRHRDHRLTDGGEVAQWQVTWDGERASSAEIVLGEGNGAGREEGVAANGAGFGPDGILLANAEVASPETPAEALDSQADSRLASRQVPWVVEATTRAGSDLTGLLLPGDLILAEPPDVPRVWWRTVSTTIRPDDSMQITLNPEPT